MRGDGPEVEDTRSRVIVRVDRVPSPDLQQRLADLHAADRLGALLVDIASPGLVEAALALPTALLLAEGAPEEGAAGVLVSVDDGAARAIGQVRAIWGGEAIVVADVGLSRHVAMEAGEAGADALVFSGDAASVRDCVAWWSQLFVLPVAAQGAPCDLTGLVAAGADFVVIDCSGLIDGSLPPSDVVDRMQAGEGLRALQQPIDAGETEDHEAQR